MAEITGCWDHKRRAVGMCRHEGGPGWARIDIFHLQSRQEERRGSWCCCFITHACPVAMATRLRGRYYGFYTTVALALSRILHFYCIVTCFMIGSNSPSFTSRSFVSTMKYGCHPYWKREVNQWNDNLYPELCDLHLCPYIIDVP